MGVPLSCSKRLHYIQIANQTNGDGRSFIPFSPDILAHYVKKCVGNLTRWREGGRGRRIVNCEFAQGSYFVDC